MSFFAFSLCLSDFVRRVRFAGSTGIVLLLMAAPVKSQERPVGSRMEVDWPALIGGQAITLSEPPVDSYQGLILGNGDIGVSLFGPPERLTLHIGKNDVWDYRDPMDDKRPVTHREFLAKYADESKPPVKNYLFDPEVDAHNVDIRKTYETTPPTSKPVGQIRFRTKPQSEAKYAAKLDLWNAEAHASTGPQIPALRAFVSYPRNLIVAEFDPGDAGEFAVELARHVDSTGTIPTKPVLGADGRDMWVRYKFPADERTYPKGFEYAMVVRVIGGDANIEVLPEFARITQAVWQVGSAATRPVETTESACVAHVRSKRPVQLLVAVVTTRDNPRPFEAARELVKNAERDGIAKLRSEHRDWWHKFWQRSFVELVGEPFLNQQWYFNQYLLACSQRAGRVAPGLFGAWAWEDFPLFGNDYHWDYNMQQAIWGAFSSNHLEQVQPYEDAALALLPAAMVDARETYGIEGAKFFLTSYPHVYTHNPFPLLHYDKMMSLNGWVAHPLWWKYLYGQDREYLRTRAYPLMRECARFYAAYLAKNQQGQYEIWPTAAWDVDFTPHLKSNRNFPMDLSFVKYLLRATAEASEILGIDSDLRNEWTQIAANLAPYPSMDGPTGRVYSAYEGSAAAYHFPLAGMMIFPGDDIGLHSLSAERETALRTLAPLTYHGDEQLLTAVMRARMGVDDAKDFKQQLHATTRANGTRFYPGQWFFWLHACGDPIWINERLLQSYTHQLRLAPVKSDIAARFAGLRAVGGFLVAGDIRSGGDLAYATIHSEAGGKCRVVRPWEGRVRVRKADSMNAVDVKLQDGALEFETSPGTTYIIDRPSDPWEAMPIVAIPAMQ